MGQGLIVMIDVGFVQDTRRIGLSKCQDRHHITTKIKL